MRLVSVLVTVALLAVLIGEVKWDEFDQLLGRVAIVSWVGALLAYLALNLFRALRFHVLLDKDDTPWRLLVPITLYHNFLVRALPFKLGELSYIALLRSRLSYSMEEGLSSLFGARILELLIIVLVFTSGVLTTAEAFAAQRDQLLAGHRHYFFPLHCRALLRRHADPYNAAGAIAKAAANDRARAQHAGRR